MTGLRIGHLANRYVLPRGPQPTAALHARLDRVASQHLAESLDAVAEAVPEVGHDGVWLVRDLHVEFTVGVEAASNPGVLARAWSQRLLVALRDALARGGADVLHFPSRAAWTARFVVEVAAGTAWDRWYLHAFSSLRALPAGRGIAEALAREPGETAAVLAELWRAGDLERVLLALGPGDARRILDGLAPRGEPGGVTGRTLARALARPGRALRPPDDPHLPGSVVRLLAAAAARDVALPPGAVAVATSVVVLADLLAAGADSRRLAAAIAARRWATALRLAGRPARGVTADELAAVEVLHALADGEPSWLVELAAELTEPAGVPDVAVDGEEMVLTTRFGGLLLLWPVFAELWSDVDAQPADAAPHRLLVAAHLLGRASVHALLRDAVLAALCGLDRPPALARLDSARSSLPVEAVAAAGTGQPGSEEASPGPPDLRAHGDYFGHPASPGEAAATRFCAHALQRFASRLPGFAGSSPGYLLRNFLDVPATLRLGESVWEAHVTGPPLQVVLRMAGLSSLRYRLPWPPNPEISTDLTWS